MSQWIQFPVNSMGLNNQINMIGLHENIKTVRPTRTSLGFLSCGVSVFLKDIVMLSNFSLVNFWFVGMGRAEWDCDLFSSARLVHFVIYEEKNKICFFFFSLLLYKSKQEDLWVLLIHILL